MPLLPPVTMYLSGARSPALDAVSSACDGDVPVGLLVQPLTRDYLRYQHVYPWCGLDNGCFTPAGQARFRMDDYLDMVREGVARWGDGLLFATAPDVAFDWAATLEKSLPTLPLIRAAGAPAALVLQDGATVANVPWEQIDAVFIGGSTEWKTGPEARSISLEAVRRGLWSHMGRVNSGARMRAAMDFGCGSADGTQLLHTTDVARASFAARLYSAGRPISPTVSAALDGLRDASPAARDRAVATLRDPRLPRLFGMLAAARVSNRRADYDAVVLAAAVSVAAREGRSAAAVQREIDEVGDAAAVEDVLSWLRDLLRRAPPERRARSWSEYGSLLACRENPATLAAASPADALGLPTGRQSLDTQALLRLLAEGRARAEVVESADGPGARRLADWASALWDVSGQVFAHLGAVAERGGPSSSLKARASVYEDVGAFMTRAASELRYRSGDWAAEADQLVALGRPGASDVPTRLSLLNTSRFGRPAVVVIPRYRAEDLGGVRAWVGRVPDDAADLSVFAEGLARYRRGAERHAPWLLSEGCPIRLAPFRSYFVGEYAHYDRTVTLHMPSLGSPEEVAHTAAHEQGHHVWNTHLGHAAHAAWTEAHDAKVPLDARRLLEAWPDKDRHSPLGFVGRKIGAGFDRGVFGLQIGVAASYPSLAGLDRARFADLVERQGEPILVPERPVTVYGARKGEESFCEALALLVALGPRAVDPLHLDLLRRIAPVGRVSNPPRGARTEGSAVAKTKATAKRPTGRDCPDVGDSRDTSRPIVPTLHRELVRRGLLVRGGRNLDLGGGKYEKATEFLRENGVTNLVVDPSRGTEHNESVWAQAKRSPVDTVTCANVLNVICSADNRQTLIGAAAGAVAPGGLVAFQVYVGDQSGEGAKTTDGWQENRKPPSYLPEIERWFGRVVRHGNLFLAYEPRKKPKGPVPPDGPVKGEAAGPSRGR